MRSYNAQHKEKTRLRNKQYKKTRNYKSATLKHAYGITADEYDAMLEKQGRVCAVCLLPESVTREGKTKALAVDHCHVTGAVRGLLCQRCNQALGLLKDDASTITRLLSYIER